MKPLIATQNPNSISAQLRKAKIAKMQCEEVLRLLEVLESTFEGRYSDTLKRISAEHGVLDNEVEELESKFYIGSN